MKNQGRKVKWLFVIGLALLLGIFLGRLIVSFVSTPPMSQPMSQAEEKKSFAVYRLSEIAKISHAEHSVRILKFAQSQIGIDHDSDEKIKILLNSEWNSMIRNLQFIHATGIFKDGVLGFTTDPLNNLDQENLKKCIGELEEKIKILRKYFDIEGSATDLVVANKVM
ncbi:MAG: hypothetical protein WC819_05695 [Parcubacteria group bacterium]